jgi:hypothetical protein
MFAVAYPFVELSNFGLNELMSGWMGPALEGVEIIALMMGHRQTEVRRCPSQSRSHDTCKYLPILLAQIHGFSKALSA